MAGGNWLLIITLSLLLQLPLFILLLNLYMPLALNHPSSSFITFFRLPLLPPPPPSPPPPPPLPSPHLLPNHTAPVAPNSIATPQPTMDDHRLLLTPHGIAHHAFVDISTYRASYRTFLVIGISSLALRKAGPAVEGCEWHPNPPASDLSHPLNDPALFRATAAHVLHVSYDEHGDVYGAAIVNCTFGEDVGRDGYGGLLAVRVGVGGRAVKSARRVVYREGRKEVERMERPGRHNFTYCGPPIFECGQPHWILHWLAYHNYVFQGGAHFFFYNAGGVTPQLRQLLGPYLQQGLVTIVEVEGESRYPSWYHGQVLLINDCLHRSRHVGRWAFFHDLDELLYVQPPWTLSGLLEEHGDKAWVTYGSVMASTRHCRAEVGGGGEWAVERMICRAGQPECKDSRQNPWKCVGGYGRRKYAARVGRVVASGVHQVAVPSEGGVDLNASIARVHHYRGILAAATRPCSIPVHTSWPEDRLRKSVPGYKSCHRDDSIPHLLRLAKQSPSFIPSPPLL